MVRVASTPPSSAFAVTMNPLTWRHSQRERASITELVDAVFDRQDTLLDLSRRDLADIPDELLDLRNFVAIPIPSPDDVVEDAEADPSQALAFPAVPLGHPGAVAPMAQTATLRPAPSSASTRPELLQRLPSIDHEQGLALDLSSNAITHLPPAFFDLRLRFLSLRNNALAHLPFTIQRMTQLKELSLGHNQLTTLPREIKSLPRLTVLSTWPNPLLERPEGQQADVAVLTPLPALVELALRALLRNQRNTMAAKRLAQQPCQTPHRCTLSTTAASASAASSASTLVRNPPRRSHTMDAGLSSLALATGSTTALAGADPSLRSVAQAPVRATPSMAMSPGLGATAPFASNPFVASRPAVVSHQFHNHPARGAPGELAPYSLTMLAEGPLRPHRSVTTPIPCQWGRVASSDSIHSADSSSSALSEVSSSSSDEWESGFKRTAPPAASAAAAPDTTSAASHHAAAETDAETSEAETLAALTMAASPASSRGSASTVMAMTTPGTVPSGATTTAFAATASSASGALKTVTPPRRRWSQSSARSESSLRTLVSPLSISGALRTFDVTSPGRGFKPVRLATVFQDARPDALAETVAWMASDGRESLVDRGTFGIVTESEGALPPPPPADPPTSLSWCEPCMARRAALEAPSKIYLPGALKPASAAAVAAASLSSRIPVHLAALLNDHIDHLCPGPGCETAFVVPSVIRVQTEVVLGQRVPLRYEFCCMACHAAFEKEQQQQQQQRSQVQPGPATPATADLQSHLEAPPPIPTASAAPAIPL
ncbi:hypothetical protein CAUPRSCDRAFT_11572 [Caulochytrium protostelioides]|uniref:L domain-like protein n=1 Tax=Caulochytrium protostelioides TaxID=1555241 RepID=A0A4P9WW39_9FUNG|nr:hypothetical protein CAUPRSCDRAFT_11572 [Caulochytrium protostelioides]